MTNVLGLDIGGANLKAANHQGHARCVPFALWKNPHLLGDQLQNLLRALPEADVVAVTMTGELCDCFASKRAGVHFILDAVAGVAGQRPVRVWSTRGRFLDLDTARTVPQEIASANWLALAQYACRFLEGQPGLLIDIGSTTTDIIPLWGGRPQPRGRTDPERLDSGELVYVGVRRTPLCALLPPPSAAEWFATTLDVHLVLGHVPEDADDRDTADGRPATRDCAHARLARMRCGDGESFSLHETTLIARKAYQRQTVWIQQALVEVTQTMPEPPREVILAGSGEFLARHIVEGQGGSEKRILSLARRLGPEVSAAACAYAVAVLAAENAEG